MENRENETQGIDYFGRNHWLNPIQERLSIGARRRMFERWGAVANPRSGETLLDLGGTPDTERADSNCMIPWFLERDLRVSMYSPESLEGLERVFPNVAIIPAAGLGRPIPCAPRSFDWVTSSAVIEHVGSADHQIQFIKDAATIARKGIFLTTPNRWHWLEFHSKLPLLHWLPRKTHRKLLRLAGKTLWADESHLRLIDAHELHRYAQAALGAEWSVRIESVWTLGMPSNLILIAQRNDE